ncbi:WD40 repeat domain-containing protein [Nitrospira sp. M1]
MRTSFVFQGLLVSLVLILLYSVFVPSLSADSWSSVRPDYQLGLEKNHSQYEDPPDRPLQLVFQSDGLSVMAFRGNGLIEQWDLANRSLAQTFQTNSIFSYAAPVNSLITKNVMDNVEILSLDSSKGMTLARDFYIHSAIDDSGRLLLLSTGGQSLEMWNVDTKKLFKTWDAHRPIRNGVAISTSGKYVAAAEGSYDSVANTHRTTIELWETKHTAPRLLFNGVDDREVHGVWTMVFSPDASMIAVDSHVDRQGGLTVWGTGLGNRIFQVRELDSSWVRALAFSPEGEYLASGDEHGHLMLWSIEQQRVVWQGWVGEHAIHSITFSPDGQFLAAGIQDSTIQVWEIALLFEELAGGVLHDG